MKPLKIAASLFVLLQAFHLAWLQTTTDSVGRIIDPSWLRQPPKRSVSYENTANSHENNFESGMDPSESSVDYSGGIPSGSMPGNPEEENQPTGEKSDNKTHYQPHFFNDTIPSRIKNETTKLLEVPANETTDSTGSGQTSLTEEEFNSTTSAGNSTSITDLSDRSTTVAPENKTTGQPVTTPDKELNKGLANRTGIMDKPTTSTAAPETAQTSVGYSSTTGFFSETTETSLTPNTPDRVNKTVKGGISSERDSLGESEDLESNPYRSKRNVAWLAVLGTAAVAACVGAVAYIILRKKHKKAFTHRKLVEEYPSDPVLRLDNCEPLDLNYGSSAYYNPGLQGDNIQMTNIPGRRQ